jgi:hypothetical protein
MSGRGRVNEEDNREWIGLKYVLNMYEYGALKLVEVIFRSGMG